MTISLPNRINKLFKRSASKASPEIHPQSLNLASALPIAEDDPLFRYCLNSQGVIELDSLKFQSQALSELRENGVALLIPLVNQGELVGMLQLGNRLSDQEYSFDDRRLLGNLAPQAAAALRVAQLAYQQQIEARRRERVEQELRVAGVIQQTLLPKEVPMIQGWQLAAHWQPARTVGGDFYDFISLRDGRMMIIIGDVTDKGVPAALVMASTRSILRSVAEQSSSPGEALRRANNILFPDMPPKMFVTCLCAVLDPQTGKMHYANAGHNASQQRSRNGLIELRARGMPLGLMPDMDYEEKETTLLPDDSILMYSDGLVEAHNPQGEMFGMKRLQSLMTEHSGGVNLISYLRDALFDFTGADWEQEDDVTFVMIQRNPLSGRSQNGDVQSFWQVLDEFEAPSVMGGERDVMERVGESAQRLGMPKARLERLKTAVAEAAMNGMDHGNHYQAHVPIKVQVSSSENEFLVALTDQGSSQIMVETPEPDIEAKLAGKQSTRGWGLFLIKAMVDEMRVHSNDKEHTIELIMKLEGDHHAS